MNPPPPLPTPPPFGDPSNIQRENSKSVGKGIAIGCGGCLGLIAIGLIVVAGIGFFVLSFIRNQEPCLLTLKAAQKSEVLKRELGEPMTLGWLVVGNVSTVNDTGTASLTIPIDGPKGTATVTTVGTRADNIWTFTQMQAAIESNGEQVDLR